MNKAFEEKKTVGALIGRATALSEYVLGHPKVGNLTIGLSVQKHPGDLRKYLKRALTLISDKQDKEPEEEELISVVNELNKWEYWMHFSPLDGAGALYISYYRTCAEIERRQVRVRIGKIIAEERMKKNIKQSELARMAELPPNSIKRIEEGNYNYTIDNLIRVAEVLGLQLTLP